MAKKLKKSSVERLFWSARYDCPTGQAIVTRRVAKSNYGFKWREAVYTPGAKGLFEFIRSIFTLLYSIIFGECRMVYLVCSRSIFGFLRDIPALLVAKFGVRVIIHTHGSDLPELLTKPIIGLLARILYERCEIIVPSAHLIPPISRLLCSKLHLVENFAHPIFVESKAESEGRFRLLWNSNIMASKGIRELVEGARLARVNGVPLILTILGRPLGDSVATLSEMKKYTHELSNTEWIEMKGAVSPEIAELAVLNADLVALPSYYPSECQPLAIVQAMCAGRKIIVADTPALRTTVGSYPGRFVQPNSKEIAFAIAKEFLLPQIDPQLIAQAVRRFDPKVFDDKMMNIFMD